MCKQTKQTLQQVAQGVPHHQLGGMSNAMSVRYASAFAYYDTEEDIVHGKCFKSCVLTILLFVCYDPSTLPFLLFYPCNFRTITQRMHITFRAQLVDGSRRR
jgi:hypothetical protein